jgi:hypothetical protein
MVADDLRRQADQFIDLADLESIVGRDPAARPAREPRTYAARSPAGSAPAGAAVRSPSASNHPDYDVTEEEV